MGRCHILVNAELLEQMQDPDGGICSRVSVVNASKFSDEEYLVLVKSPLLADGYHGQQQIVIEADGFIAFKPDLDT